MDNNDEVIAGENEETVAAPMPEVPVEAPEAAPEEDAAPVVAPEEEADATA